VVEQGAVGAATDRIGLGERRTVRWAGLTARAVGEATMSVAVGGSTRTLAVRVRAAEPAKPADRPDRPMARATPGEPIRGILATSWSRLCFVAGDDDDDYAIAETWDGRAWQRAGTLYPLARVVLAGGKGAREEAAVRVRDLRAEGDRLTVLAEAAGGGAVWPLRITCRPDGDSARIRMDYSLTAPEEAGVLAFYGPTVLAGDRAYGARKDFAVFPGLEFLEGEEESSSSRDLVPPLSDRRVPVAYKIATPLMAVQGRDSLVALMWDANQEWASGEKYPAARFLAAKPDSGPSYVHMALFAPSVGKYVEENHYEATKPYPVGVGQRLRLSARLVLDHAARYEAGSIVRGPHRGGLVLLALRHWFEAYGLPEPSPQPRDWEAERELSRAAYLETLWNEDPPGWPSHIGDRLQANVTLTGPLLLDLQAGVRPEIGAEIRRRIDLVVARSLAEEGTVCRLHSNQPFLQFHYGGLAAALRAYRGMGNSTLGGREQGLWVWRPGDREHRTLGVAGTHTLGQAAYPSLVALSAARYTGEPELARRAVEALRQMELYDVPRGASMWECPQYQPDLLAASLAVKAYCEAYRLTGDAGHLEHARYWAWTGLPFLYTWEIEGYPTMLYNSIGVIGSTYYTHSWLGRPVVWMGLDYACALQELAEYDDSFPWLRIAQGITSSAQWQQYTEGESKGCYPDSWEMAENRANPADINPILILLNEYRLRGLSLRVRCARFEDAEGRAVFLNSGADIVTTTGGPKDGRLDFQVKGIAGSTVYSAVAQVAEPRQVVGCGERVGSDEELGTRVTGWLYDPESQAIVLKHDMGEGPAGCGIRW